MSDDAAPLPIETTITNGLRVDRVRTNGIFSLDGGDYEVENNVWIVGDDSEVVIFDAAHEHDPIVAGVDGRNVKAIVCTHGHNDHINAAGAVADTVEAPILIHPSDAMLWEVVYPDRPADGELSDNGVVEVAGTALSVLNTPGHSPGCCCFHAVEAGILFSGDTLFCGGPGATGRSFSDFPTIIDSIKDRLFVLPEETVVHTGHGDSTTIGAEAPSLEEWIARGS